MALFEAPAGLIAAVRVCSYPLAEGLAFRAEAYAGYGYGNDFLLYHNSAGILVAAVCGGYSNDCRTSSMGRRPCRAFTCAEKSRK
jgi:hypothetical protein